jgi:hypothetical protein
MDRQCIFNIEAPAAVRGVGFHKESTSNANVCGKNHDLGKPAVPISPQEQG